MPKEDTLESLLTPDEVCDILKVTKPWLYDEVQAGRFPHLRLGRRLRFRSSDLSAYIEAMVEPCSED